MRAAIESEVMTDTDTIVVAIRSIAGAIAFFGTLLAFLLLAIVFRLGNIRDLLRKGK